MNFADKLTSRIKETCPISVGLDPRLDMIPQFLIDKNPTPGTAALEFNKGIIDAVKDLVPVVKPQIAYFEMLGLDGMAALAETVKYAKEQGLLIIMDAKRNDIGSTCEAYANAYFTEGDFEVDALTVNGYLGYDGIKPFIEHCEKNEKGIFILVKTSNPSSGDIQDRIIDESGQPVFEFMAQFVDSWGSELVGESGYSPIGAVVGATYPEQAKKIRLLMPNSIFLVPGYGAQGGGAADVKPCFSEDGTGAIVNSSRGIIFAYQKSGADEKAFAEEARLATVRMKEDLASIF
jgi:orotidine-5'-phosphate decarboxylase